MVNCSYPIMHNVEFWGVHYGQNHNNAVLLGDVIETDKNWLQNPRQQLFAIL